jgi:hypothetical protein
MRALSKPNIESELSYAYLHAVVSQAGMACQVTGRHQDCNGIDAEITAWGPFADGGYIQEIDLKVQLKATVKIPADDGTSLSYFLEGVDRYNDLRTAAVTSHRILVVLFLPSDSTQWVTQDISSLVLRKCAYWVSLRGAQDTTNGSGVTVKLPKNQIFNPDGLATIAAKLSRKEELLYIGGSP